MPLPPSRRNDCLMVVAVEAAKEILAISEPSLRRMTSNPSKSVEIILLPLSPPSCNPTIPEEFLAVDLSEFEPR